MLSKNANLIKHNQSLIRLFSQGLSSVSSLAQKKHVVRDSETLIKPKYKEYSYAVSSTDNIHLICDTVSHLFF
jgi:hypothetical protein